MPNFRTAAEHAGTEYVCSHNRSGGHDNHVTLLVQRRGGGIGLPARDISPGRKSQGCDRAARPPVTRRTPFDRFHRNQSSAVTDHRLRGSEMCVPDMLLTFVKLPPTRADDRCTNRPTSERSPGEAAQRSLRRDFQKTECGIRRYRQSHVASSVTGNTFGTDVSGAFQNFDRNRQVAEKMKSAAGNVRELFFTGQNRIHID